MNLRRQHFILIAFAVTITLVVWTAWRERLDSFAISEATAKQSSASFVMPSNAGPHDIFESAPSSSNVEVPKEPSRSLLTEAAADPFKVVSFLPLPPKAEPTALAPPPPQPAAPPFPYRYFGQMTDIEGKRLTYLARDQKIVPIHERDILDNMYLIESINETQVVVTNLPLSEKTVLTMRSAAE